MCELLFTTHTTCGHRTFTRTPLTPACGHICSLNLTHLDLPYHCSACSDVPPDPETETETAAEAPAGLSGSEWVAYFRDLLAEAGGFGVGERTNDVAERRVEGGMLIRSWSGLDAGGGANGVLCGGIGAWGRPFTGSCLEPVLITMVLCDPRSWV